MKKEEDWCKLIPEEDENKRRIQRYSLPKGPKLEEPKKELDRRTALKS